MSLASSLLSVVENAIRRPLPYADADRIAVIYQTVPGSDTEMPYTTPRFISALRSDAPAFVQLAAWFNHSAFVGVDDDRRLVPSASITHNFFRVLGPGPILGRGFLETDDARDGAVILSHAIWSSRFGSDSAVIGRPIALHSEASPSTSHRVVGVMPAAFDFPPDIGIWFLIPAASLAAESVALRFEAGRYGAVARLAPGESMQSASVQVSSVFERLFRDDPSRATLSAGAMPLRLYLFSRISESLQLWGALALVVGLLCALNFSTMVLARGLRRLGEIGVRVALGASRMDIAKLVVGESLVIAGVGGALAIVLAKWMQALMSVLPPGGRLPLASIAWPTAALTLLATGIVGAAFALVPSLELSRASVHSVLQRGASGLASGARAASGRRALVALQVALALTAVATVSALVEADRRFRTRDVRFDYSQLMFADFYAKEGAPRTLSPTDLIAQARLAPGVVDAALTVRYDDILVLDPVGDQTIGTPRIFLLEASANLFRMLGVTPVTGHVPTHMESVSETQYVVSHSFARRYLAGDLSAIGRRVRIKRQRATPEWGTVVAVVSDLGGLEQWGIGAPLYALGLPRAVSQGQMVICVSDDPAGRAAGLVTRLRSSGVHLVSGVRTAVAMMDAVLGSGRSRNAFLSAMAALALFLSAIGVYSLMAFTVELRLTEFAIRSALGATSRQLVALAFADILWMAPFGIGVGFFAAGRAAAFFDHLYRTPLLREPLVLIRPAPTIAMGTALLIIAAIGAIVPMLRLRKLDTMRTVQSGDLQT